MECKFYNNVISYQKDRIFFHFFYRYDGNRWARVVMCSKAHPHVKALFAQCGGLVPPPLNDMEVLANIPNGWTEDVVIKTLNPLLERKFALMFQVEGVFNFTPFTNRTKVPNNSTNNNIWTFQQISLPKGLNSTKKQDLDKKWATFSYEANIPFNVVQHPAFIETMKTTSKSRT